MSAILSKRAQTPSTRKFTVMSIRWFAPATALVFSFFAFTQSAFAQTAPGTEPTPTPAPGAPPAVPSATPTPPEGQGSGPVNVAPAQSTTTVVTPPEQGAPPKTPPVSPEFDTTGTAGARAVGLAPPATRANDFMDTRLSWTFGDDDFLHKTGQNLPISPKFSVGDRAPYRLFFDNLNSRFSGRENVTHLVMYKKMPGFIEHLTTEAALVLRFDLASLAAQTGNLNTAIYDSGSYIRIFYNTGSSPKEGLSAIFFPLDTDRFRLGYLYDISWGGTAASINQSIFPRLQGSSPGAKIQFDGDGWYGFAGFKTAQILQPESIERPVPTQVNPADPAARATAPEVDTTRVAETNYGFLLGGGVDPLKFLRFDLGLGYFQQGKLDYQDVRGRPVYTYGTSGRIVFHHNMPVPQSVDFQLYRNDPMAPMVLFAPEKYDPGEVAYSVSAEASVLRQHLKDFDAAGATKDQTATAGALQGVIKAGYARLSITGIYRDLNFVVRNIPGFIPFHALPSSAQTDPEMFGALAADYYIQSLRLTPGIGGGIQLPTTFKSEFSNGGLPASRVIVVRQQGDQSALALNQDRGAIYQSRLSLRWTLSDMLSAFGWLQMVYDPNLTFIVRNPVERTIELRVEQNPWRLGAGVSLQARF